MNDFRLDRRQVRRAFGRAADHCADHDVLQREVQATLLDRLAMCRLDTPECVVDVGAGSGRGAALLKQRWPRAEVLAIDIALPMLRAARRHVRWRRSFARVCAEATRLPLPGHSVDVLHSNLCFQWCDDLPALFGECVRVLKPGGFIVFSTLGPDTLRELRAAWAEGDDRPHVGRFLDMHDIGDAMLAAGLDDPVLDVERYTLTYADPRGLLDELKGLGATNADAARRRGLTGKARYRRMLEACEAMRVDGRVPATVEVIAAHARGPDPRGSSYRRRVAEVVQKWPRKPSRE